MNYKLSAFIIILSLFCSCKRDTYSLSEIKAKQLLISDSIPKHTEIEGFISPYRESVNKSMDTILAFAPETYSKNDGLFNTAIGNLMADIVFKESNPIFSKRTTKRIDAVILNHGGIRSIISKGTITTRTAYEVMPFENSIVVVALKGKQLNTIITFLSKAKRAHPISGIILTIDKNHQIIKALVGNKPIDESKTYYVATSDYLYNGGDKMTFFKPNSNVYNLDYKIRNAMLDYFKKVDTINPKKDNRFIQI